ncbi:hypothetical protein CDL15_Pgr000575 [Punica granatum]|uniref:CBM20 domain-containing protein n=1 Tax=Punica granatum TaxID=22663 RepID=A0A218W3J7_PUNGR|nr:hypothetical protein CDL15_Pgr000575 [Punica granatum]
MDAITSHCPAKLCVDNRGVASKFGGTVLLWKELSFSRSRKVFGRRVLRSASEKLKPQYPASSPNAEVQLELFDSLYFTGLPTDRRSVVQSNPSKTVHVRFQLKKECRFGEQFLLVGDDPIFGSWDPSSAIPMNWSDDNIWTLDLDIPIGRQIQFKFILRGITGIIHWQPDPDRVLKTWETDNTITVYEDWEDAASQRITEGQPLSDPSKELTDKSEMHFVADNISPPMDKVIRETENKSVLADNVAAPAEIPIEEARDESAVVETKSPLPDKSLSIVAENIAPSVKKPSVDTADDIQTEEIVGSEENYGTVSNNEQTIPEDVPRSNPKDKAVSFASKYSDGNLITFDEGPVLVPGLIPLSMALAKEQIQLNSKMTDDADVFTGLEAEDPKLPEIEERQVPDSDQHQEEETAMALTDQQEQLNEKQKKGPQSDREEETAMALTDHQEQLNEKQKEGPRSDREEEDKVEEEEKEENVNHEQMNNVLRTDIQWGRKTLQNFLANLGLLL